MDLRPLLISLLFIATARAMKGPPMLAPPATRPGEVASLLADLGQERDALFLNVDGRPPSGPGEAPPAMHEAAIRLRAMARGRDWPGRWTLAEIEVRPTANESLIATFPGGPDPVTVDAPAGAWTSIRVPLPPALSDLRLIVQGGLHKPMSFRQVRLIDDRQDYWSDEWRVRREAASLHVVFADRSESTIPGPCEVLDINLQRAVISRQGRVGAIFRTGRVCPERGPQARLTLVSGPDEIRIDRTSDGDSQGNGYDERLGALILRAPARHFRIALAPADSTPITDPAIELRDLPPGPLTLLVDGRPTRSFARLAAGGALVVFEGRVSAPAVLEVSVAP